jgi:hypothetical protein
MRRIFPAALVPILLAACGGGGGPGQATSATPPAPVQSYRFVAPKAGAHLEYASSLLDNQSNTLNRTVTEDVTAVSADGSFGVHEEDPSHNRIVSGATDQSLYPTDYQYNAAGQPLAWTVAQPSGSLQCTISGGGAGAPATLASGADWNAAYTQTCGGVAVAETQSGTYAGIESVTVPAGTFSAYKFLSTTTRTVGGITRIETSTRWRDASGGETRTVRQASVFAYSGGTPPAGAPMQEVRELKSYR